MTRYRVLAAIAGLLLAVLGGYLLGRLGQPGAPGEDSVAVGFARDMATHHEQAVDMALTVLGRGPSPEVATMAYDIAGTQAAQRGVMLGWLSLWGRSTSSDRPPMAWMGMPAPSAAELARGVLMPGMASRDQLGELRRASGRAAGTLFLRLMIQHHLGGIHMAEAALAGRLPAAERELAASIAATQRAEIATMSALLTASGAS